MTSLTKFISELEGKKERCEACGSHVSIYSSRGGTNSYVPVNISKLLACVKVLSEACEGVDLCNMTEFDDKTHHELLYMAREKARQALAKCESIIADKGEK